MSKHTTLEQLKIEQLRTKAEFDKLDNRIKGLETTAGEPNKLEGVQINGTALTIASKLINILIATGTQNGTISIANVDYAVKGLADLAYKSEVSESDLADALKAVIDAKLEADDLSDLENAVETLIGNEDGDDAKSVRAISAEEVAKIVAGADQSYDTLKEIADWIMSDQTGAAKMSNDIEALKTKLTLGTADGDTEYTTVKAYVEAVAKGLSDELDKKVDKREGYGLSKNDFTDELKAKLNGIETATNEEVEAMLNEVWGSSDD